MSDSLHDRIEQLAYQHYLDRQAMNSEGGAVDDWLWAEHEVVMQDWNKSSKLDWNKIIPKNDDKADMTYGGKGKNKKTEK